MYPLIPGIAIEHGRNNIIMNNIINNTLNNDGIMLWTDLEIHYNMSIYSCLNIYNQEYSYQYNISNNIIVNNNENNINGYAIHLMNVTNSTIYNNYIIGNRQTNTCKDNEYYGGNTYNKWNITMKKGLNIIGGKYIGGNYYGSAYNGKDCGNGFGCIPFNNSGLMSHNDFLPLI